MFCTRAIILFATVSTAVFSQDYFVSPTGNDNNTGDAANPLRQIREGVKRAVAGDRVLVADGSYLGFDVKNKTGTAANPITIMAQGSNAIVTVTTDRSDNRDTIFVSFSPYVIVEGFKTFNANRAGLRVDQSNHVTIRNCTFGDCNTWGMFTDFCDDILIENNTAYGSKVEHGIYFSNSGDRPTIRGNRIYNNNANGLHMNGDVSQQPGDGIISNALVENNIIYGNGAAGGSGINCDGVNNSVFRNNLIYAAHGAGISLYQIDGGGASTGNVIVNNTIDVASNGKWCVQVHNGAANTVIFNNILLTHHTSRGSLHFDGASSLTGLQCDYNVLTTINNCVTTNDDSSYLNFTNWKATGRDTHSITATQSALFISDTTGDYHLKSGCAALDIGIATLAAKPAPGTDLEGNTRPDNTGYDLGAFELLSGVPSFTITGNVSLSGTGLSNVVITAGSRSALTDGSGNFTLSNVPNGSYTLVPALTGYAFSPTSRNVTVAGAAMSGQNFTAASNGSAPAIVSVSATPSNAAVNQSVSFVCAATDADGDTLSYAWNFADGSSGTGASLSHAFSAVGTYAVSIVVSDGTGRSTNVGVTVTVGSGLGGDSLVDTDGDGVSDSNELADGTDPLNPNSLKKIDMTITQLRGKANLLSGGRDMSSVSGVIPNLPAAFDPTQKTLEIFVGGAEADFTLDVRAKGTGANGTAMLKLKPSQRDKTTKKNVFLGGPVSFKATLKNGTWSDDWADDGLKNATTTGSTSMLVDLWLNGRVYTATVPLTFKSKADKAVTFKK